MAASSAMPATPMAKRSRPRGAVQLSAQKLERMSRKFAAAERSLLKASHARTSSLSGIPDAEGDELLPELGENGELRHVPIGGGPSKEARVVNADDLDNQYDERRSKDAHMTTSTEYWLKKNKKAAPAPSDNVSLARAVTRGLTGKGTVPPDSYLQEASFVFNPLSRRAAPPTPQKSSKGKRADRGGSDSTATQRARGATPALTSDKASQPDPSLEAAPSSKSASIPLDSLDDELQEALILEDLLYVLVGIEGAYVQFSSSYLVDEKSSRLLGAQFTIDEALNPSIADLLKRILPLATYYTSIFTFIEMESSLEFGTVTHALCAAIRDLLKEYELLTVQLETQFSTSADFSLQKLYLYVLPTLRTFELLSALTTEIASINHADVLDVDSVGSSSSSDDDDPDQAEFLRQKNELLGIYDDDDGVDIAKGGEILAILWDRISRMSADSNAHKLFTTLFQRASQPYARTLIRWISTGHLADMYEEFMVMEDPRVTQSSLEESPTDEYWESRYTLRDETLLAERERLRQQGGDLDFLLAGGDDEDANEDQDARGILIGGAKIPAFLEPWKHKVLLAGKYLNVIRECGIEIEAVADGGDEDDTLIIMNHDNFFRRIEEAYQRANTTLLQLLLRDQHIIERLRSLKHYFLISQADFFSSFLEQASRELRKTINPARGRETSAVRLQTHLGMVLGSSASVGFNDPYREDVRVDLSTETVYEHLKRIADTKGDIQLAKSQAAKGKSKAIETYRIVDLLQFDIAVKFPVSLIISRKNIVSWQFLQRCLLDLKVSERALCDTWQDHQSAEWRAVESQHAALEQWKARVGRLRHRMLFFTQQVLGFMTSDILEAKWIELEEKLARAKTVDQFMKDHSSFLNSMRKDCMLTDFFYIECLAKLMNLIHIFVDSRVHFRDQLAQERAAWASKLLSGAAEAGVAPKVSEPVAAFIGKIEKQWDKFIKTYRDIVTLLSSTDVPAAVPLSYRLQFVKVGVDGAHF